MASSTLPAFHRFSPAHLHSLDLHTLGCHRPTISARRRITFYTRKEASRPAESQCSKKDAGKLRAHSQFRDGQVRSKTSICNIEGQGGSIEGPSAEPELSRRHLGLLTASIASGGAVWGVAGAARALPKDDVGPQSATVYKTASGVKVQDVVQGSGQPVQEGDVVEYNYVCRRANGYFVYSTVDQFSGDVQPAVSTLGEGKLIKGLEELFVGMRPGGKRRALVPPEAGYTSRDLQPQPSEFGPLRSLFAHASEPLFFEVQLLKVKS